MTKSNLKGTVALERVIVELDDAQRGAFEALQSESALRLGAVELAARLRRETSKFQDVAERRRHLRRGLIEAAVEETIEAYKFDVLTQRGKLQQAQNLAVGARAREALEAIKCQTLKEELDVATRELADTRAKAWSGGDLIAVSCALFLGFVAGISTGWKW